jgi:hypothetical protein
VLVSFQKVSAHLGEVNIVAFKYLRGLFLTYDLATLIVIKYTFQREKGNCFNQGCQIKRNHVFFLPKIRD